jgi:iron complex transport system permease protein
MKAKRSRKNPIHSFFIALVVWVFAVALALKLGAAPGADLDLVIGLRISRVILASAVGMGLAVAGLILQALFSNPLCEPYTIGISSGASLGAVIGASLGLGLHFVGVAGSGLVGALLFTAILYLFASRSHASRFGLLLAGVMLGFFGSSLVAIWMVFADLNGLQGALFWLLGDLSRAQVSGSLATLIAVIVLVALAFAKRADLDALLLGEDGAASLGVDIARSRRELMLLSALLVSFCVSSAGMIGFVGLVIPHFVRRSVGSLHVKIIPLACIWGATALVLADVVARVFFRPFEVPVGVVTAVFGAPLFIYLMLQGSASVSESA